MVKETPKFYQRNEEEEDVYLTSTIGQQGHLSSP
jgi:hypothetical protein